MPQYGVDVRASNLMQPLMSLQILYEELPETTGCERCEEVNGDDVHWCCRTISPSMYYVEFLHVWKEVQDHWSKKKRLDLVLRAIDNYLNSDLHKGCIFYDKGCTVYKQRPFNCRMYGVLPDEVFQKRLDALKERDGDDADMRPQCDLVSCAGNKTMTEEDEQNGFDHIVKCERRIGVHESVISHHDTAGGSYRTFHDHLLKELFQENFLIKLTEIRLSNPSEEDRKAFIKTLSGMIGDMI